MSDSGLVSHCLELLAPLGRTSSRRMFGGHALYIDGLCMALIIQDTLYLKVDDTSRPLFEREGCRSFTYDTKHGERHALGYFTAPEGACPSFTALYAGLHDLERDLHRHIHLENNVLFPAAVELETHC